MKTFPDRHTKHITIGVDPILTYNILSAVAKRRAHVPFFTRVVRKLKRAPKPNDTYAAS